MGLLGKMPSVGVPEVYIFVPNLEHWILRVLVWNIKYIYIVWNKIFFIKFFSSTINIQNLSQKCTHLAWYTQTSHYTRSGVRSRTQCLVHEKLIRVGPDLCLLLPWSCPAPSALAKLQNTRWNCFLPNWEYWIHRVLVWNIKL